MTYANLGLPRHQLEELARRAFLSRLGRAQQKAVKQTEHPSLTWARSYTGRPIEFIGELLGPDWYDTKWTAWRTFIKSVFGLPITDPDEIALFQQCTGLSYSPDKRSREVWLPVGRRGGKSRILALIAVHLACCYDWSQYLVPGERGSIPVLAESRDRAKQIMDYVKAALKNERLTYFLENEMVDEVFLKGNLMIRVSTASIAAVRSRTVISALCDEIAFWPKDDSANPDRDILGALRPAMVTVPTAMLLCGSSPYGKKGVLYEAYRDYFAKPWDGRNLVWHAPTWVMHPDLKDNPDINKAYQDDPNSAGAEYGAVFREDVDVFVPLHVVQGLVTKNIVVRPPVPFTTYEAFVDPSGGSVDSMTLAIGHKENDIAVLDTVDEVLPPFEPSVVVDRFAAVMKTYGVRECKGDRYAGEWPTEAFNKHSIEYIKSELTKSDIYREFLPILMSGRIELLDSNKDINQISSLERRTARGGRDSIDHPPGSHDDRANVIAGVAVSILGEPNELDLWRKMAG